MDKKSSREGVWELAEPLAAALGLELVDVEVGGAKAPLLRVFVDRSSGAASVSVEDCEALSRRLTDVLDASPDFTDNYTLEVSSPGVNRRLRKPEHFSSVVGQRVRVRTGDRVDGRRNFLGRLVEVNGDSITLEDDSGTTVELSLVCIDRANYEHDFDSGREHKR